MLRCCFVLFVVVERFEFLVQIHVGDGSCFFPCILLKNATFRGSQWGVGGLQRSV